MSTTSVLRAAAVGATVLVASVAGAASALAATGTVNTAGAPLTVRASASSSATAVGSVADGASITISCQTHGSSVSGTYGTSDVWDYVPAKNGYVADAYVYTGSDGTIAPACSGGGGSTSGCTSFQATSCGQAVSWAKNHIGTHDSGEYGGMCDHVVGLAYGLSHSGSTTAYNHWLAIPSQYRHAGDRTVPAGGLAFFRGGSSGAGHVMISIGNGEFVSNDIVTYGTLSKTTIGTVESRWGQTYLGWAQPWFQANH